MNQSLKFLFLTAALLSASAAVAQQDDIARAEGLKKLVIENGFIISVERDAAPVLKQPNQPDRENLPPRTIVKLELHPVIGSTVRVELWLPDAANWNGNFLGVGSAGGGGHTWAGQFFDGITAGYATAATDVGTSRGGDGNPEVWRDFGHRATHLMTVSGKLLVEKFYGRPPARSYFFGNSTGGQQALSLAQRHPADYDAIAAGVPAHSRTPLHAYFVWNEQVLAQCPFTKEQLEVVAAAGREHFGQYEAPQFAGRLISNPRWTAADIDAVTALALKKDPTLTPAHGEAMRKLFDGPRNSKGERIFNGVPPGTAPAYGKGFGYPFQWVFGKEFDPLKFSFDADMDAYTAALAPHLDAENDDLRAFKERGGKLVVFSGASDPVVPWHATADYYERVCERLGEPAAREFFRYYLVPSKGHPGMGLFTNSITEFFQMAVAWREKGEVPGVLHLQRVINGKVELELDLEPYRPDPTRAGAERIAEKFRPGQAE